ncbi:hypothetical protein [Parasitella parasitica]|uniref:Uncharacterized protein n=1 Tax=Parasitella parasitica TaxID=35722 RepID=A0A0B7MY50_9FUNG|nr:hypothetical protein [Parasitella parasitica]
MFEPKQNIRKKPLLPVSSQSSNVSNSTVDSYSIISKGQLSEDSISSSRSRALQYQASLKKLNFTARPSKSESTNTQRKKAQSNLYRKSTSSVPKTPSETELTAPDEDADTTFNKLKSTFIDVIEGSSTSLKSRDELINAIKSQVDAQTIRIRRLERALKEKDDQLIKGDNENTIPLLLSRYPHSMDLFKRQIEQDHYNHHITSCIDQFEDQKARMLEEYQKNFEALKMKYRSRFDDIVERMISDPSRLDDEWARRVHKEADDRIEEFKKKIKSSSNIKQNYGTSSKHVNK